MQPPQKILGGHRDRLEALRPDKIHGLLISRGEKIHNRGAHGHRCRRRIRFSQNLLNIVNGETRQRGRVSSPEPIGPTPDIDPPSLVIVVAASSTLMYATLYGLPRLSL